MESTLAQEASTANALTIRVANSVCVGSVAFVVLCNVSSEAVFHRTGPVVQVSRKQPPAARRTSWWAGRHHHCPCCGSSGLGEPLPLALTGAVYDPVDELLLGRQDHRTLECQAKRKFQDANAGSQHAAPKRTTTHNTHTTQRALNANKNNRNPDTRQHTSTYTSPITQTHKVHKAQNAQRTTL